MSLFSSLSCLLFSPLCSARCQATSHLCQTPFRECDIAELNVENQVRDAAKILRKDTAKVELSRHATCYAAKNAATKYVPESLWQTVSVIPKYLQTRSCHGNWQLGVTATLRTVWGTHGLKEHYQKPSQDVCRTQDNRQLRPRSTTHPPFRLGREWLHAKKRSQLQLQKKDTHTIFLLGKPSKLISQKSGWGIQPKNVGI